MDLREKFEKSRKERVKNLIERIDSGEYQKEADLEKEQIDKEIASDMTEEDWEKIAEKNKEKMKRDFDRGNK